MPDREKVIEGLKKCAAIHQGFVCESCEYPGCNCAIDDAIALLKAQEREDGQRDYEAAVEMQEYCERYEPTYNAEDGSM